MQNILNMSSKTKQFNAHLHYPHKLKPANEKICARLQCTLLLSIIIIYAILKADNDSNEIVA